jgi:hypothetical protein
LHTLASTTAKATLNTRAMTRSFENESMMDGWMEGENETQQMQNKQQKGLLDDVTGLGLLVPEAVALQP